MVKVVTVGDSSPIAHALDSWDHILDSRIRMAEEADHRVSGVRVPHFITQEEVDKLKSFSLRSDDVWIVAYPKAGSTWTQQIVRLLQNRGEDDGKVLSESVPWLEALSYMYPHIKPDQLPSPRLFQSHFMYDKMPCGSPNTTPCKYIYVARNPKDLVVSYYYHHRGFKKLHLGEVQWEEFFELFVSGRADFGDYFEHVLGWWAHRDDDNVLFLKYEDMKKDLPTAVASIAKFIEKDKELSTTILDQVVKRTTFDAMKSDPKANHSWTAHHRDPSEPPFMRKGVVGDWKNLLTAEQSKRMDTLYQKLQAAGLEFDFDATTHQY